MNKRILLALSCFLLAGITLLTIASTYTSSDSAHRFNGTIYATDSSLAGTANMGNGMVTNLFDFSPSSTLFQGKWAVSGGNGSTNVGDGTYDEVFNIGFNYQAFGGGKRDGSLNALKFGLESNWKQGGKNLTEWNIDHFTTSSPGSTRAFSMTIDNTTGEPDWFFVGTNFTFCAFPYNVAYASKWTLSPTANASLFPFNGSVRPTYSEPTAYSSSPTNYVVGYGTYPFDDPANALWYREHFDTTGGGFRFVQGIFGNGTSTNLVDWYVNQGTNVVFFMAKNGGAVASSAGNWTFATNGGDVNLQTVNGSVYIKAQTTGIIALQPAGTGDVEITANKAQLAGITGTDIYVLRIDGHQFLLGPYNANVTGTAIGQGTINSAYGGYVSWDANGDAFFYGKNAALTTRLRNNGAVLSSLSVGSTTYIDASYRSQTNQVAGALTFSYCTNGVHGSDSTTVRWLFNSSGSDQTLTFPIINTGVNGWRTNVYSAVPPAITNNTIMKVILDVGGPTDTLALQTNCYVKFEYYQ